MTYLIYNDRDTGSRVPWREDPGIRQHLESMLEKTDLDNVYSAKIAPANLMFQLIRQKILHRCTEIISGSHSAADGLEVAKKIAAAVDGRVDQSA